MALIESLMKTDMVTASPDETVQQVADRMNRNGVGAILVLDGDSLIGLFSERDLLSRVVVPALDPRATAVRLVMTADPITVDVATHVRDCAVLLREKGFRHLPVTRDGKAVGILSSRDLHEHVAQSLESFVDRDLYQQALAAGEDPYDHVGGSYGS